jgi:hypothetical protein
VAGSALGAAVDAREAATLGEEQVGIAAIIVNRSSRLDHREPIIVNRSGLAKAVLSRKIENCSSPSGAGNRAPGHYGRGAGVTWAICLRIHENYHQPLSIIVWHGNPSLCTFAQLSALGLQIHNSRGDGHRGGRSRGRSNMTILEAFNSDKISQGEPQDRSVH